MNSEEEKAIHDLKEKLRIAMEALSFYANPENYGQGESFAEQSRIVDVDLEYTSANRGFDIVGGKLARRALLEIEDLNGSQRLLRDRENLAKK